MESIDSPEIPDRRGTSDIPGHPSRDSGQKEGKPEREIGLGRRTREEIAKWNQLTALRFQTGGRHQISPASFRGIREQIRQV